MEKFKHNKTLFAAVLLFFLATSVYAVSPPAKGRSPRVLLQKAIYAEETEGDLDKAIELYQQVIDRAGRIQRIAARATYQLAMCYLKKGEKKKAAEYFQQVVSNYPTQKTLAKKAQDQLNKIIPPVAPSESPLMLLPTEAYQYIFGLHLDAGKKASELGIPNNTHIYGIDDTFIKHRGGLIDVFNMGQDTWTEPMKIAQFTYNNTNLQLFNDSAEKQQFEWKEVDSAYGTRCQLIWTPDRPVKPGEFRVLGYIHNDLNPLPKTTRGHQLIMQNDFGSEVIESFFLVLPAMFKITGNSSTITSHQRIGYFDIYEFRRHIKGRKNEITVILDKVKEYPESAKPVVVDSFPKTYSNDVDPGIDEITVTFDQDMFQYGWSWCRTGSPEIYPEVIGNAKYIDARTCRILVKVAPAKAYIVLINTPQYRSFRNTDDIPAAEFAIVFATKDTEGNPTEIPADLLQKARAINERNAIPKPVLDIVPATVRTYIADHFRQTHITAEEKGLRTNSHVHIIDEDFNRDFGLIQIYKNKTGQVVDYEVSMGSNDSPENYIYDGKGVRQKIRTRKIPGGNYRYFWTPSEPIAPGETRMLFYSTGTRKLNVDEYHKASLRMQNYYGSPVIENFYLVLPVNVEIDSQSEPFTSHETIEGFDIYCWSKEQGRNVKHLVNVVIQKRPPLSEEVAFWIKELYNPDAPAFVALEKLVKIRKPAVEPLIAAMEKSNDWQIPKALGAIKDKRAIGPLIEKYQKADFSPMKEVIAEALSAISLRSFGDDKEKWVQWWQTNGKCYTPTHTIKNFMAAAIALDVDNAMSFVAPTSHDYEDIKKIFENSEHPFNLMFQKIDPAVPIEIIEAKKLDRMCTAVWRVTFKEDFTIKGKTFKKGETFDLDGGLRRYEIGWLITGI